MTAGTTPESTRMTAGAQPIRLEDERPITRDRRFGLGDDDVERGWIGDGDLGEHLAIELDVGLRQPWMNSL